MMGWAGLSSPTLSSTCWHVEGGDLSWRGCAGASSKVSLSKSSTAARQKAHPQETKHVLANRVIAQMTGLSLTHVVAAPLAAQAPKYVWEQVTANAPFAPRAGAGALTFQGRMWLLGGWNPADKMHFPRTSN